MRSPFRSEMQSASRPLLSVNKRSNKNASEESRKSRTSEKEGNKKEQVRNKNTKKDGNVRNSSSRSQPQREKKTMKSVALKT